MLELQGKRLDCILRGGVWSPHASQRILGEVVLRHVTARHPYRPFVVKATQQPSEFRVYIDVLWCKKSDDIKEVLGGLTCIWSLVRSSR